MHSDPAILTLQANLSRLGFRPGRLDGLWGSKTARALRQLAQRENLSTSLPSAALSLAVQDLLDIERVHAVALTEEQLSALYPRGRAYLAPLNAALWEGALEPVRAAAFLAQLGHESGGLKYMEEVASGANYEGRADLGNTEPGDGRRFKGRGPIQLTGRANYRRFGRLLGEDLEGSPERAAEPEIGFRTAVMYWTDRNLNSYADIGAFKAITKAINGGFNGLADRESWWRKSSQILGV